MNEASLSEMQAPAALRELTAQELMTPSPLSIRETASVREALAFLVDRGISGAPVIDKAGRAVGVLSQTDLLIHDRETVGPVGPAPVGDLMTPAVFSVTPETPTVRVIEEMCALNVHRLFVVNRAGVLVGVVSALDVLRRLVPSSPSDKVRG